MKKKLIQIKHFLIVFKHNLNMHWKKNGYKYLIIFFTGIIIYTKDIYFVIQLKNNNLKIPIYEPSEKNGIDTTGSIKKPVSGIIRESGKVKLVSFGNESSQEKRYKSYINNHYEFAVEEMHKYKIPASITLAQGLLETNGGKSKLATRNNNHFGIKCFSRKCKKGHCSNFNDDSHKDFFRIYNSTKESYRAHSLFLKKSRYENIFSFSEKDYKSWAHELKKSGYATDKKYAYKLIALIEKYELYKFDEL